MSIKLVISDMDGTLIDKDEVLPEKAIAMVNRLRQKGILFTVATGRVESMADSYIKKLGINIPYIACNGATIASEHNVIQRNQIRAKGLKNLLLTADKMGMSIIYTVVGKEFIFRATNWIEDQREKFDRYHDVHFFTEEEWDSILIDKVTVMDDIRDGRITIIEDMCKNLGDEYCYTRYTDKAVEIVEKNSNKGNALKRLSELLGIELSEVMAIGDHQNDIEMFAEVGYSAAVANAIDSVKAVADYVCNNRSTDGVIEAVEKFCLQENL